jgi:DNA polymerase-1
MTPRTASIDIETNYAHDKIHMAWVHFWDTDQTVECYTVEELISELSSVDTLAHWNGIGFDLPVIKRVWDVDLSNRKQLDGMLLSRLHDPSRPGGHSLASYGTQFGYPKGDFKDFDAPADGETEQDWLARMSKYCEIDTRLNTKAVKYLQAILTSESFSEESWQLEHDMAAILTQQRFNGFKLDIPHASNLYADLTALMRKIERTLQDKFPPIVTQRVSEKTGKALKDNVEVFNIGSRQQIAKRLESIGAVFSTRTEKGNIIVDESSLGEIDLPEAKLVLEYLTLQKRTSQINSWLEVVADDGRVHGRVNCNGAVTGRMTHSHPNMAQIPAVTKLYGAECRQCWTVEEGNKLVGIDASGLELRMLAHYMKDDNYTEEILDGDVHTANQQAAGLATRDQAKTFIYAFLYGAGDAKIGSIVGGGKGKGAALKRKFLDGTPSLRVLRDLVKDIAEKHKSLPGLDGRRLRVRHQHAALNTLLQGAGAIDMRCPLGGEYNIGNNWAETH